YYSEGSDGRIEADTTRWGFDPFITLEDSEERESLVEVDEGREREKGFPELCECVLGNSPSGEVFAANAILIAGFSWTASSERPSRNPHYYGDGCFICPLSRHPQRGPLPVVLRAPLDNYAEVMRRDGLRDDEGNDQVLLDTALAVQLRSLRRQAWRAILNMDCQGDGWERLAQWFAKRSRLLTENEKIIRGQLREVKRDWDRYLSLCARSDDEQLALERIRLGAAIVAEEAARTGKDLDAQDILLEQQHSVPPRELGFGFKVPYFPVEVGGVVGMGGPGGLRGSVRVGLLPDYPFRQKLHDAFLV
ncbi:hypothetical protein FOZ63_010445, partial [Perkinsus olseni]